MISSLENILFVALPYTAFALAVVAGIYRYRTNRFSYSSLSSQFLESKQLFWGSVPFHWGLLAVFLAHLIGLLFPAAVGGIHGSPARMAFMEITGLAFALLALLGLVNLIVRRMGNGKLRVVTSPMDVVALVLLFVGLVTGIWLAVFYRWGSDWYWQMATPYLWSLVLLKPEPHYIASLPLVAQVHVINAFLLLLVFPFTRLVHAVTVPIAYLWRPWQLVRWYRRGAASQQR
jgi:nitrate reductase gamma subunit